MNLIRPAFALTAAIAMAAARVVAVAELLGKVLGEVADIPG